MEIKVIENQNAIYSKEKLLGEGAFGKAYLVKHKQTGQYLVIKEMNIEHMSQKEKEETFKEAQILKNLSHPNIVKFKEVYLTKNNKLKIVMEYAECGDLAKAIQARKAKKNYFQEDQILGWFTQICLAIKHVHDRKILHRDIKGQNIFVTKSNTLKLGDFGIARVLNKTMEKARTVVGTPYYLSPEIIENKPYSFSSDIWSIGAVLYEMCALQPPFVASSLQMLALKIVKGSYPQIPNMYSADMKALISSMLTLNPSRRPSINDLLKNRLLQDRIRTFLSDTKRIAQFSHTILHNQKVQILANKLVKIQEQKKQRGNSSEKNPLAYDQQRKKLKEEQVKMQAMMQKKKIDEKKREQDRRKLEMKRREEQERRDEQQIKRREEEKRRNQEERRKWIQREKEREKLNREKQYEENRRMAQILKQRRDEEQREYERQMEMNQLLMQKQQIEERARRQMQERKRREKQSEQDKKAQDFQDAARKQYFENLEIRKRAQQRAKRDQESFFSEPAREQPPAQNYHYQKNRPSSKNQSRPYSRERKTNKSDNYGSNNYYQPSSQQLQNAYVNPNFNRRRPSIQKKSEKIIKNQSRKSTQNTDDQQKESSRRKIEDAREKMRRDRQNFVKNKSKGTLVQEPEEIGDDIVDIKEKTKIGKWGKKNNSRNNSSEEKSPRFNTEDDTRQEQPKQQSPKKGFKTLIEQSEQLFLQPQNPAQFNNYIEQLQDILDNVQKNIEILPDIPYHDEILFREDDEIELELSLTADNPQIKKKNAQIQDEEVDLELFSNFSKLETLRIRLEEAFGLDNFIGLYRYLQEQVNKHGLQNINIVEAVQQAGGNIDGVVLKKNLPFLLTLVTMQDRISCM